MDRSGAAKGQFRTLALKRNRQSNGSDGDKERRCNKTAWLQRNGEGHRCCHDIEDNFARPHPHSLLCDSKAGPILEDPVRGPALLGSLIALSEHSLDGASESKCETFKSLNEITRLHS